MSLVRSTTRPVSLSRSSLATAVLLAALAPSAVAQTAAKRASLESPSGRSDDRLLTSASATRIADPKLQGAAIQIAYGLKDGTRAHVVVDLLSQNTVVTTIATGTVTGTAAPISITWDGKDEGGRYIDPGDYVVRVRLPERGARGVQYPLSIVRLGITKIAALPNGGDNEWQMVYFRKNGNYAFYATPAIHEYLSVRDEGEISALDLDNGEPRPAVPLHTATDEPAMEGPFYEDDRYNYPVTYLMGTQPVLDVKHGPMGTSASGQPVGANYPVAGYDLRVQVADPRGAWTTPTTSIAPGTSAQLTGPALPAEATRTDLDLTWTYQYRATGSTGWTNMPGSFTTSHRFYTMIAKPIAAAGATGVQYERPWVEVAEYFNDWKDALGVTVTNKAHASQVLFIGFFGQTSGIPTAIEGVVYDCYPMGGDGGRTRYYNQVSRTADLSSLFNNHARSLYVNCSDCASSTSTMLAMLGVNNIQLVRLGSMQLNAIWGIGTPDYTLNLWGTSHGFSYHHIVTRFGGDSVSDSCMSLDEDGDPTTLPGTPGYNVDRVWDGPNGYDALSARNRVTKSLEPLPKMK